jgi:hypothetical protein
MPCACDCRTKLETSFQPYEIAPCPTPAEAAALGDVEAATLAYDGSPPITRITLPACCAHYPGGPNGCLCRLLRHSHGLPRVSAGSASALWISRPAQASLALRPAGPLDRQKRPLSRGFGPSGCPPKPLVNYQINRQLSGRNPPPQVTRVFGAHPNEPNSLNLAQSRSSPRSNASCGSPGSLYSQRICLSQAPGNRQRARHLAAVCGRHRRLD